MENIVQQTNGIDDAVRAFLAMIVLLICVECAKEPEYICEKCDKVYKQEARYRAHMMKCVDKDTSLSASEFSVLLRQNHEMMVLLQKQQETIQLLLVKMNIE
jgi:hypothetical protein